MSWEKVKLGDIIEVKKGKYITKNDVPVGPYPVILGGREPAYYINQFNHTGKAIVVSRSGASAGYVSFWNEPIFITDGFLIEPQKNVDIDFLYYLMKTHENQYLGLQSGSAIPHVTPRTICSVNTVLPPLNTQVQIANILRTYDSLIENNRKQIKLLEEAAQRLYKEWFVDLHFPGYEKTAVVDGVPEGWKRSSIDDVADYLNGYAFKPDDWQKKGMPIIKIKEMNEGVTASTPRNNGRTIPTKYIVAAGDILFSWSATLTAMIWDSEDGLLNQHLFKVTPKKGICREYVLQSILRTLDEFKNLTSGATMKHIQRGKLKEVFVKLPTDTIMNKFASVAELYRERILRLQKQNIALAEARDRLLPKLMSGEIEVK